MWGLFIFYNIFINFASGFYNFVGFIGNLYRSKFDFFGEILYNNNEALSMRGQIYDLEVNYER